MTLLVSVVAAVSINDFVLGADDSNAPSASLQYSGTSDMDFEDINDSFSHQRLLLEAPLGGIININDCTALSIGLRYEAVWLDTNTALGNMDLHDARVSFTLLHRQAGSKWSFLAALSPGIASDFDGVSGDDFSLNGKVGVRYEVNDKLAFIAGLGVDNTTGDRSLTGRRGEDHRLGLCYVMLLGGLQSTLFYMLQDGGCQKRSLQKD